MEREGKVHTKDLCPVLTLRVKETQNVHALVVDKAAPKAADVLIAKNSNHPRSTTVSKEKRKTQVLLP